MTEQTHSTPTRRRVVSDGSANKTARDIRNMKRRSLFDGRSAAHTANDILDREQQTFEASYELDETQLQHQREEVQLDETQLEAVEMCAKNQYAILTGYAGSGKTTTLKAIIEKVAEQVGAIDWTNYRTVGKEIDSNARRPSIVLACYTNKAASNIAAKLPEEWAPHCMSIHSMLAYAPVTDDDAFNVATGRRRSAYEPRYHGSNPLPIEAIFIDEAGIVDKDLWNCVLDAVTPETRIYLIGDMAQLPAPRGVSPMPFAFLEWPHVVLDKIYRQADGGRIIPNLTAIRRGLGPTHDDQEFRCGKLETLPSGTIESQAYLYKYISYMYKKGIWDPVQDIIITPQNEGVLGQQEWNQRFYPMFNPRKLDDKGNLLNPPILIRAGNTVITLSVGAKVMATSNGGRAATERRFTNGSVGIITKIEVNPNYKGDMEGLGEVKYAADDNGEDEALENDLFASEFANAQAAAELKEKLSEQLDLVSNPVDEEASYHQASHIVTVTEQATGETYLLTRAAEINNLQYAYAATAHKFQGSQARNVMVICHSAMRFGLFREWLYTACSRAQERVFLMHQPKALETAVQQQRIKGRNPIEKAENLAYLYEKRPWGRPEIPEARKLREFTDV